MSNLTADHVTYRDRLWLEPIIGRMRAEDAADLTDTEIERTLSPCVCGPGLVRAARRLRDAGLLTVTHLHPVECRVDQVAPAIETGRIATGTESARPMARTGSAGGRSAHPVQQELL